MVPQFGIKPTHGEQVLQVLPSDLYSSSVLAMSPRLVVAPDQNRIQVTVEFYMNGSSEYPAYLKVRRRLSYT